MEHESRLNDSRVRVRAIHSTPHLEREAPELRETLDRAFQSGTRLLENRVRLIALDTFESMRAKTQALAILAAGVFFAALAWMLLVSAATASLWGRFPPEALLGTAFILHLALSAGFFLLGRYALAAETRKVETIREEAVNVAQRQ